MNPRIALLASLALVASACGQPAAGGADASPPQRDDASVAEADAGEKADGSAPETDAAEPPDASDPPDAAGALPDAAGFPVDASSDAAAEPDAEAGGADAGPADASEPGLDAAAPPGPDAATPPGLDAATPPGLDAATPPGPDAATPPGLDAAAPGPDAAAAGPDAACAACSGYGGASIEGLMPGVLAEVSGLAMTALRPGVLFAHNDSGDGARFFALDLDGNLLGEFVLTGATVVDWEDMAVGPCPAGSCVYLGDIGDNNQVRTDYAVFRAPVPDVHVGDRLGTVGVAWERLPFEYPAGAKWNAETLLVHPRTGDVYVANKLSVGKASTVFKFPQPLTPGAQATLVEVAVLPIPGLLDTQLTGGDIHPCGDAMLLRTYNRLFEFRLPAGAASFDAIFTSSSYGTVPVATEQQGETVAYLPDGKGYVTASEAVGATPVFVNAHACQ